MHIFEQKQGIKCSDETSNLIWADTYVSSYIYNAKKQRGFIS